jgi:predicted MFS family arabinose efflux permease
LTPTPAVGQGAAGIGSLSRLAMFAVVLATYVVNAMDRQVFPLLAPDIRHEFGLALPQTGLLSTILMLGMAVAGLPTSFLIARWRRKSVLICGILLFSLGTGLSGAAGSLPGMALARALTGVGEAMQVTVIIAIAAHGFFRHRTAAIASLNVAFGIGAIIGPWAGAMILTEAQSWRVPLYAFAAFGGPAALAVALCLRPQLSELPASPGAPVPADGGATLLGRDSLLLSAMTLICGLMIYGYLGLYPTYLREVLHYAPVETSRVMSLYGVGVIISVGLGWLGDRLPAGLVLPVAFALAGLLGALLFSEIAAPLWQGTISCLWGLILSGVIFPNLAACHVKAAPAGLADRAAGMFITTFYGAGAAAGFCIGWLASRLGWALAGELQFAALAAIAFLLALTLERS